ncbi:MAG: helix-turn-helix domain-containing protein [Actinomycetota bacterium]|jgi:hypothetical protein|nr:helix-turn-helix domain-containing protein [Actinomycetota bacterium]
MDGEAHGQTRTWIADLTAGSGWVTTDVAARAVRVSPRTIRRLIERGELVAKQEGEGVEKRWLVSVDSLHILRASRFEGADGPRGERIDGRGGGHESIADTSPDGIADGIADVVRELAVRLEERTAEAVEFRMRLELTEKTQSTLEEELREERRRREEAERERDELRRRLEAAPEVPQAPESAPEASEGAEPRSNTVGAQESARGTEETAQRPWWVRIFGG